VADDADKAAGMAGSADRSDSARSEAPGAASQVRAPLPGPAVTVVLRDVLEPALAAALRRRLPVDCGVHLVDISVSSVQGFRRNVQEPTCCYTLTARSSRGGPESEVWVDVGGEIAHPVLEALLGGGGGRVAATDRPLTAVERRLLRRLPQAVGECLTAALVRAGVSVELSQPSVRSGAAPGGLAAVLTFRLSSRGADGAMRVALPAALVEAMLPAGLAQRGQWAAIELSAALPDTSLPASEAAALEVGDILTTDTPPDGEVTVRLAGVAKFTARLGACDGRRAITITRPLPPPQQE
jgi:flagellar motor switch protein FliM